MLTRWEWLWREQNGRCALRCTEGCQQRGHMMHDARARQPDEPRAEYHRGKATWEHVWPQSKPRPKGEHNILVIACSECNVEKGARDPTPTYLASAKELHAGWTAYRDQAMKAKAQRQAAHKARMAEQKREAEARRLTRLGQAPKGAA